MSQTAVVYPVGVAPRTAQEKFVLTDDGVKLFYRYWPGTDSSQAVILLHRGHEHSGRIAHLVPELDLPHVSFFAWDARGHGQSGGDLKGKTMSSLVHDLDTFVRHVRAEFNLDERNIAIVGQSLGAVIAAAWVHDYAPSICSLVLAAPAFKIKLYVPFARLGLTLWQAVVGDFQVKSYVKGSALTHDRERSASYRTDPLLKLEISAGLLLDTYRISNRLISDAAAIRVPTQMLLSGSDWVVHNKPAQHFVHNLGTTDKEVNAFPGFYHDTFGEKDRHLPIAKARAFLHRTFTRPESRVSLQNADQAGFTRSEYDTLRNPLSLWSVKGFSFALTKLFLRTVGRLSDGIRLGGDTGYDSGSSLDYVYRNQPSGITPIGKLIDYFYLNSPGWRGIRVRKQLLEVLIQKAMTSLRRSNRQTCIVDVAAGHGRYVLEAIARSGTAPDNVLLRDLDPANVERGRQLIANSGLVATFEQGDAFDEDALANLQPRPTLAVVAGIFELFPQNNLLRQTLSGLGSALPKGGYIIYTGQPWHPQLEFIARTLSSHRGGAPWIMRRRTQEELDELVQAAGFRKLEQRIDPEGLFTVTLAEKI